MGCQRLRKLWLFQNKIKSIQGLHSVPELEECWLQGNVIKSLQGIETCVQLTNLGMAGNLISDVNELRRLGQACPKLAELSLSDIHFGGRHLMRLSVRRLQDNPGLADIGEAGP